MKEYFIEMEKTIGVLEEGLSGVFEKCKSLG